MVKRVLHISQLEAQGMEGSQDSVMVSIMGASRPEAHLQPGWRAILRTAFDDVDREAPNAIQPDQALQLIDFLDEWSEHVSYIVVHCAAGISRSAAVARFAAERYGVEFNWSYDLYNRFVYQRLVEGARAVDTA